MVKSARRYRTALLALVAMLLTACGADEPTVKGRWYTQSQLDQGKQLYLTHCARCHGAGAQGSPVWNKPLADGSYPPPPLNGSAHSWHHPLWMLKKTIQEGGAAAGGKMPPFGAVLDDAQQSAVVAYFQSRWPDPIYEAWIERGGLKR